MRVHIVICSFCRRYERQLKFLRAAAHRHCDPPSNEKLSAALSTEARERITQAIRQEQR